jgi:AbrB family looped-hinge helix DNA binding protein
MNTTIKLQQRGVITLPKKLRDALQLSEGQTLRVEQRDGGFFVQPEVTLPRELAEAIADSKRDIANGDYITFSTIEEFHEKRKQFDHAD